ncbi:hypothetical protein [Vibrio mediterranei]|uniref:hypothetical protein n=1 Tax=Vibrio mediterranei TaxID=689 RepID=UPI0040697B8C
MYQQFISAVNEQDEDKALQILSHIEAPSDHVNCMMYYSDTYHKWNSDKLSWSFINGLDFTSFSLEQMVAFVRLYKRVDRFEWLMRIHDRGIQFQPYFYVALSLMGDHLITSCDELGLVSLEDCSALLQIIYYNIDVLDNTEQAIMLEASGFRLPIESPTVRTFTILSRDSNVFIDPRASSDVTNLAHDVIDYYSKKALGRLQELNCLNYRHHLEQFSFSFIAHVLLSCWNGDMERDDNIFCLIPPEIMESFAITPSFQIQCIKAGDGYICRNSLESMAKLIRATTTLTSDTESDSVYDYIDLGNLNNEDKYELLDKLLPANVREVSLLG